MSEDEKKKIMVWDDAGLWMHKPDTIEKVKEDMLKMFEECNEALNSPELFFISSYTAFRRMHINNVFLMKLIGLIQRIERLNK